MIIKPITSETGATVEVEPEAVLADGAAELLLGALNYYNVLVFPQVHMSDDIFLALTAALGDMHENKVTDDGSAASNKGIFRIALDKDDKTQREFILGNDFWHMDGMSYSVPVKATLLKCESAPKVGGDTGFANLHAAYAALPDEKKQRLAGLTVGHCLSSSLRRLYEHPSVEDFARWDAIFPRLEHPLVWTQESGKSALLIGSTANDIAGMAGGESRALLDELLAWCIQNRFTYRHKWHDGDLVIFNNPGLLHRSYPYDDAAGRVMHRTTLKGREATTAQTGQLSDAMY
ncbi:TauD/TfdA family dioxygenase [Novosphingobium sp. G106]|uniref:TauD/TfdA dioxygenase family protein n=1 Tax=Novosphingobium sp. G106 TaxID=2849500 RepID=UPI001C2D7C58|nr:TauD/TfdA family dioxygenase [Novosphingobium sp. G106]MBV1688397.1 TauD/TfdA family dioxygenase [Novosphingobium sp. G106]